MLDPQLDLSFERIVDVTPERIWEAWTRPELLVKWFTPAPWKTVRCDIDLRPGGVFGTVMRSPEGQEFPGEGCYLEIVPNRKLTWTNALGPGFRPVPQGPNLPFHFTATIALEPHGSGTRYRAIVLHGDAKAREQHAAMKFEEGWGKALDQLVELAKGASGPR